MCTIWLTAKGCVIHPSSGKIFQLALEKWIVSKLTDSTALVDHVLETADMDLRFFPGAKVPCKRDQHEHGLSNGVRAGFKGTIQHLCQDILTLAPVL